MLAETLSLLLVLASAGTPRAQPAIDPQPDNAIRARRGLLPRKVVRTKPPQRGRRVVLPQAPTWLGEPGEVADLATPGPGVVLEPVADRRDEAPTGPAVVEAALTPVIEPAPAAGSTLAEVAPLAVAETVALAVAAETAPTAVAVREPPAIAGAAEAPAPAVAGEEDPSEGLRAVLAGVDVGVVLLHRLAEPGEGEVRAAVTEPQLQVLLVRRSGAGLP